MRKSKRGSLDDVFFLLVLSVIIAVTTIVAWLILSKINTALQAKPEIATETKSMMTDSSNRYVALFDNSFLVVVVLLALAIMFFASQIDASPVFLVMTIVLIAALILVSAIVGNTFYHFSTAPEMADYADDFTIIPFFFNHIVAIMVGFAFLVVVIIYAKSQ